MSSVFSVSSCHIGVLLTDKTGEMKDPHAWQRFCIALQRKILLLGA